MKTGIYKTVIKHIRNQKHEYIHILRRRTQITSMSPFAAIRKYGVRDPFEVYNNEYAQCVYMVIYTQTDVLMEDQAEIIIKTKNSLVIDHLDAAILHLEIGRNLVKHIESSVDPDGL